MKYSYFFYFFFDCAKEDPNNFHGIHPGISCVILQTEQFL